MHTYVKLKDGRIMILWSDDSKNEIIEVYELKESGDFDPKVDTLEKISYDQIVETDTNLAALVFSWIH